MNPKFKMNSIPMGIAALTAVMFSQSGMAQTITNPGRFAPGTDPTSIAAGIAAQATNGNVTMTDVEFIAFTRATANGSESNATPTAVSPGNLRAPTPVASTPFFNNVVTTVGASNTPSGASPVRTSVSPGSAGGYVAYVSDALPGEYQSHYVHTAESTPDSTQVIGSGAPVNRFVRPVVPSGPSAASRAPSAVASVAAPAPFDYCSVNSCIDAPLTVTTILNAPVAQPPTFNIPAAVPPNFDAAALSASLALGFGDRAVPLPLPTPVPYVTPPASDIVPVASFDCNAYGGCMGDQADGMGGDAGGGVGGGGTGGGAGTDAGAGAGE